MPTTWVIAADAGRARIFEMSEGGKQLQEIEDLLNPETRPDERRLGRFVRLAGHPAVSGPAQSATEQFSKRLGDFVEQGRAARRFDRLCLIAPSKFLDLMRQHLGQEARKLVAEEIPKDLVWSQGRDIADYIRQRQH